MREFNRRSVAATTAVTMGSATFAQVVFSVLASDLISDFDVRRWQIGALVTATGVTGALLSPSFGKLTDRLGPVWSTRGVLTASFLFLGSIAVAPTYAFLALAAVLTGVAQGWCNPATNALIVANVDAGTRGVITGIKQSGVQVGTFLGGLALPPMALAWGWWPALAAFLVFPLSGLIAASLRRDSGTRVAFADQSREPIPTIVSWVAIYGTISGFATSATFTFLPLFAEEGQGWSISSAGLVLAGVGLVGVIARISWGTISERWLGHGRTLRILAIQASLALLLLSLIALGAAPSWLLAPAAVLFGSGAISWNAVGMLAVMDLAPPELVGRSTGRVLLGFLLGTGLGAPVMGFSVDRLGSYAPGWLVVTGLFCVCVSVAGRVVRGISVAHS